MRSSSQRITEKSSWNTADGFTPPGTMKEELIHVPLLVRIPGLSGCQLSRQPFSHLDLAPTLLEALNLQVPADFRGRSRWREWLAEGDSDRAANVESAECTNPNRAEERLAPRVLCVRSTLQAGITLRPEQRELFDLYEDPGEKQASPRDVERIPAQHCWNMLGAY